MRSGSLRHRILIQVRVDGVDEVGQPVDQWLDVVTIWASIDDTRGREFFETRGATVNEVVTRIVVRYRTDLRPEMRIRELCHAFRNFEIRNIQYTSPPRPEVLLDCAEIRALAELEV